MCFLEDGAHDIPTVTLQPVRAAMTWTWLGIHAEQFVYATQIW